MIAGIITVFVLPINENSKISIVMLLILVLIMGIVFLRPRLMYHIENVMFYRLKEKQGPSLQKTLAPDTEAFKKSLENNGFTAHFKSDDFTIFKKYAKDRKIFLLKRPMLMVFVVIHQPSISYQSKLIVNEINRLEDSLYKNKQRIVNYTVYIAKSGQFLTPKIKDSCDYVTFSKVGVRSVVNINLFYENQSKSSYFLYSETYAPNSYYRLAVDLLKKIVY